MPIFELICNDCGKKFERVVNAKSVLVDPESDLIHLRYCPKCGSKDTEFTVTSHARTPKKWIVK
jgi:Zn finger protein HypA/HybF involved in hydrogenase expression